MGLDNGIYIKRNEFSKSISEIRQFEDPYIEKYGWDYEVCYWRKCYGLRGDIIDCLDDFQEFDTKLNIDNVRDILKILQGLNKNNWGNSIWDWEEIKDIIKAQIKVLKKLIKLMDKYNDLEVYFLDSY